MAGAKSADTSAKPPAAKKKKKTATPASLDSSVADRLVYLTGIPKDASEQEVTDLAGSFGKINNVILMPCSEEESEKGEGQKASVCMVKAEDAQVLANSTNLSIRDQAITALVAKKPEAGQSSDANNSKAAPEQEKGAAEDGGGDADHKTSDEKGVVLITGLPESGWSESDVIALVQPFGTPSDIIQATQMGKVLVSVPDTDTAEEMVKVHAFMPAKMKDCELKMVHVKQHISLSTPVALYNLLMGSSEATENPDPVFWSSLLVISNVPNAPSGSSEVQKLVRRFGTVIKTLVLNSTVICEMATAPMALSVYKRFQTFPCIIQNNPLFFSRKPDPKVNTHTKVITMYLDSPEETPANGKGSQAAAADQEEAAAAQKEISQTPPEGTEKDDNEKEETTESAEKTAVEDEEALGGDQSKDEEMEMEKEELSDAVAAPHAEPEAGDVETDTKDKSEEENKAEDAATAGTDTTLPAGEETKMDSCGDEAASQETAMPPLPQVTQEMVNALLVECRTRTASNTAAVANGDQGDALTETEEAKEAARQRAEEEAKRQERERKEREARKEKELRERERKERERRAWEKEERSRREREREERSRRERERREEERRERERRERKRAYGEGLSGSRSYGRSGGYRQSSWRDEEETRTLEQEEEEEEDEDEFPFNMSDFVTVDEVGDVTDLPSPHAPSVPMETTEGEEDAPMCVEQDAAQETPLEVSTETTSSDATAAQQKPDENVSESDPAVTAPTAELLLEAPALQADPSPSTTHEDTCEPKGPDTEVTADVKPEVTAEVIAEVTAEVTPEVTAEVTPETEPTVDFSTEAEPPADCSSHSPAAAETAEAAEAAEGGGVTSENEKKDEAFNPSQAKTEDEVVSDTSEEKEKVEEDKGDKETRAPAVETGNLQQCEDQTPPKEEEAGKKKSEPDAPVSTEHALPPFDPSRPVGMEFLIPKTGFFCKVCNRFFSGNKEAEMNHCRTLKHYENLQKHLQSTKKA